MAALIGLIGAKQSGKDTLAARLTTAHGFTRYALADPMREFALALDPIVEDSMPPRQFSRLSEIVAAVGWDRAKEHHPEVRRTLQRLGTEAGRNVIGEDFWINITDAKVTATLPAPVVITDIRFPNEYAWIKRRGGVLVRITRPGVKPSDPHSSEAMAWDRDHYPEDILVCNDGTMDDLTWAVDRLAHELHRR